MTVAITRRAAALAGLLLAACRSFPCRPGAWAWT